MARPEPTGTRPPRTRSAAAAPAARGGAASRQPSMRDNARKRAKERREQRGGLNTLILPEGVQLFSPKKNVEIDILPYIVTIDDHPDFGKGKEWYKRTFFTHRDIGPENKVVICPQRTYGLPCPICEELARMKKDPNANEDTIKALYSKERVLYNVIDLNDPDKGVQVWDMSYWCFQKLLDKEITEGGEELAGFAELAGGMTIQARFEETKLRKSTFMKVDKISFVQRGEYGESILNEVHDLDKCLKPLDYHTLTEMFLGLSEEGQEAAQPPPEQTAAEPFTPGDAPEPEAPGPASNRPARRTAAAPPPPPAGTCPSGHVYGQDCDMKDECGKCTGWDACRDEADKLDAGADGPF